MKYYLILSRGFSKTLSRMRMIKQRSDNMGCYYVGEPLHEDGTTTFEKTEGIHQRYIRIYKCTYCGLDIIFPADMSIYPLESKIDFNYCPYCGRPVVESEEDTNE